MDRQERRRRILNQLRLTFEAAAVKNESISRKNLIGEIIKEYEVSARVASEYIREIILMGMIKQEGDLLWHSKESEIRKNYLIKNGKI